MGPIGKPRVYKIRGFSLIPRRTEAKPTSRAFLFAEHHMTELRGKNPRQTTLRSRGWLRNRCVNES